MGNPFQDVLFSPVGPFGLEVFFHPSPCYLEGGARGAIHGLLDEFLAHPWGDLLEDPELLGAAARFGLLLAGRQDSLGDLEGPLFWLELVDINPIVECLAADGGGLEEVPL